MSAGPGPTLTRPPASNVSKTIHRKYTTQANTHPGPHPVPPVIPPRPQGTTRSDLTRGSVSGTASGHSHVGLMAGNNSNVSRSANASGHSVVHSVNARQPGRLLLLIHIMFTYGVTWIADCSKSSTARVNPVPVAPRVNEGRAPPPANAGPLRQGNSRDNTRNAIPNPAPAPPPNIGGAEAHAPMQREVTEGGSAQLKPIGGFYQTKVSVI